MNYNDKIYHCFRNFSRIFIFKLCSEAAKTSKLHCLEDKPLQCAKGLLGLLYIRFSVYPTLDFQPIGKLLRVSVIPDVVVLNVRSLDTGKICRGKMNQVPSILFNPLHFAYIKIVDKLKPSIV